MRGRGRGLLGKYATALAAIVMLGSCGPLIPPSRTPPPAPTPPANAIIAGVAAGPSIASYGIAQVKASAALASFQQSCPQLLRRQDASGLTRPEDWQGACTAAATWPLSDAVGFFQTWFEPVRVGDGRSYVTGYYEPEIAGQRTPGPGFNVPVYGVPPDLVRGWPDDTPPEQRNGRPPFGRYDETGKFVPYYTSAEIENGALAGKGLEIAWAADPIDFFFLQIQGSGLLRAPDGSTMRIGYAGQNGRPYTGIGQVMKERGLIGEGTAYPTSMQGIVRYLRDHPGEARGLMDLNQSYVFFKEMPDTAVIGSLGVPVQAQSTVAADPRFVPLGAPVFLSTNRQDVNGLWVAQDVGGAIKGANRFDSFWGAGDEAEQVAGGMSARGQALVLVPKGTLARLKSR
ncbi:MAG TPA: murein transglycosylase A [Croceibacterium sp.]|jgi:membrane-bound lytic murein transglycosylase A